LHPPVMSTASISGMPFLVVGTIHGASSPATRWF
jgi:hypothetical protein